MTGTANFVPARCIINTLDLPGLGFRHMVNQYLTL